MKKRTAAPLTIIGQNANVTSAALDPYAAQRPSCATMRGSRCALPAMSTSTTGQPMPIGQRADPRRHILVAVVDDRIRASRTGLLGLLGRTHRRNDLGSPERVTLAGWSWRHSISSSARTSRASGILRPRTWAVFRLSPGRIWTFAQLADPQPWPPEEACRCRW